MNTYGLQILRPQENPFRDNFDASSPKTQPRLTIFPATQNATGAAVLVCPGGGYFGLAVQHEGRAIAQWLNARGLAAFVLEYRVAPDVAESGERLHPLPLRDAQNAMRFLRDNAAQWNLDARKIGVWGFSAGGHLAATLATNYQEEICRPDFAILSYPVILFDGTWTQINSRENLLGAASSPEEWTQWSAERNVSAHTPPCFLFSTGDDAVVPVQNSVMFYLALRSAGVAAELHVYESGPHGVGLADGKNGAPDLPALASWSTQLHDWLKLRGAA